MPAAETKRDGKGEFLAKDLSIWRQAPGPGADAGSGSRIQVNGIGWAAGAKWAEAPTQDDTRDEPLVLSLSEG